MRGKEGCGCRKGIRRDEGNAGQRDRKERWKEIRKNQMAQSTLRFMFPGHYFMTERDEFVFSKN